MRESPHGLPGGPPTDVVQPNGVATFDGVRVGHHRRLAAGQQRPVPWCDFRRSYRGEYFLLLTPTLATPTRTAKGGRFLLKSTAGAVLLRIKPGAWATHGVFIGNATDIRPNPATASSMWSTMVPWP